MNTEFNLLSALTAAIEAVRTTTITYGEASRATWAASASVLPELEANAVAAQAAMAHAKHELAAALSDAQSFIAAQTGSEDRRA